MMTKTCVRSLVTGLFLGCFVVGWFASAASALDGQQQPSSAQTEEKPAEQVYKNIQIFKGVPASRLMAGMMRISQFLGVDCAYCHVPNQFEKDDKPAKQTARKMFQLVRTINQELNSNSVTCYTCHRGQPKPVALPPAPTITQPKHEAQPPVVTKPAKLPTVTQVRDNYLRALGGKARLQQIQTRVMKGSLIAGGGFTAPLEIYEKAPNKNFTTFRNPMGVTMMGFDGAVGWVRTPEQGLREQSGKELAFKKSESEFFKELRLQERYPRMVLQGIAKLGERDSYVIEATTGAGEVEALYFDTESGLLVRQDFTMEGPQGKATMQTRFEDYRAVDGVKLPFVIHRSRPGFTFTHQFDEVKLNVPVDNTKFRKPSP